MDDKTSRFLRRHFDSDQFQVLPLAGDASNRKYFRVIKDNQSWVLMSWEPFQPNSYPFLSVLQHFAKHKVTVPEVVDMSPQDGLVLLEDLGDLTLERKFWENQNHELAMPFYQQAIDELIKIHYLASNNKTDCTAFKIQFDTEKLLWEMNYGKDNLLKGICQFPFAEKSEKDLVSIFTKICERLHAEPKYIAHRDYHSRNLMIKLGQVRVIDFQDARMGAIQYDLVSLLRDSYVRLSDSSFKSLIEDYLVKARDFLPKDFSREQFDLIFEVQTIQRCFKACGSFSSFYVQRGDTRYLKYIQHTLKTVMNSLSLFPEYKYFSDLLVDSGALDRKYEVT